MVFFVMGAVSAGDINDVSTKEDSNLINGNVNSLSTNDKLEVSSEDSISETNIVNSHDDNLGSCPIETLNSTVSNYEDNVEQKLTSNEVDVTNNDGNLASSSSSNDITGDSSNTNANAVSPNGSDLLNAPTSTKLTVSDTHYDKSATYFKVTLSDNSGNALAGQSVSLAINGITFKGVTDSKGVALIKTSSFSVGTYSVSVAYGGNNNYTSSSLSKKVKVLSSISGSDLTKYFRSSKSYVVTFWKDNDVLANTKVSYTIDGKKYSVKTNSKGVAKINVNLATGKYVITVTNPYSGEKLSNNIVIKKAPTTITPNLENNYIVPGHKYAFSVTLKTKGGALVKNAKVYFKYNGKTVTDKTDKNGKATITIPVLSRGTYKITFEYDGNKYYGDDSGSANLIVKDPKTQLSSSKMSVKYNDGSKFKVKLTNSGKALANKDIRFKIDGKVKYAKTNSKGYAKITIPALNPNTYKIGYSFSTRGSKYFISGSNKIVISRAESKLTAGNLVMDHGDGSYYNAVVKDLSGKALKNVLVKSTINGKNYIYGTDSKGVAKLKINLGIGYYSVSTVVSDPCYESNKVSKHILVNGTKFIASELSVSIGENAVYSVKLVDGKSDLIKGANVKFTVGSKSYSAKTNSKGIATVNLGTLAKGQHTIKFSHSEYSGSSKIHVGDKVTIKQLISASATVKNYIEANYKLPSTVKVGSFTFSTATYLYLLSKAIINIKSNSKADIPVKDIGNPTSPKAAANLGNLYDYLTSAKKIVKYSDSKGVAPNSVSSNLGSIGYKGIVYALARALAFYGDEGVMPAYTAVKTLSPSSGGSANSKNTITNLAKYLASSTNCQVGNSKIKSIVTSLTKDCTTDREKAVKIFNYVRDVISYSFYYDTKYGALGTLNAKKGNCVDQAHLLVAMYRTAGLAARYVHGTCVFSSGSTYGHVWSQVLIGDTWIVADATSSRNSFGSVVNWNTNSYSLHGYYASLPF